MLLASTVLALCPPTASIQDRLRWDAATIEHLLNRAGFGATPEQIEKARQTDRAEYLDGLFGGFGPATEPFVIQDLEVAVGGRRLEEFPEDELHEVHNYLRFWRNRRMLEFAGWWIDEMRSGGHPLRERMTLFWHGHFATSARHVKSSRQMIRQNELFRREGLGSFRTLLHGVMRDPALLRYLDSNRNDADAPNENLARELFELFTLGEGNFTERDVQEAARALTGWHVSDGRFRFVPEKHDGGVKEIFGERGAFTGAELVELTLRQDACSAWLARKLLVYFAGVQPGAERVARYSAFLREGDYDIESFLRHLFDDPWFYSDAVVGQRIAGPIDYLVGTSRRLRIAPPAAVLFAAAEALGQHLFWPPNVKGWEGGRAWISSTSLLRREEYAQLLLGIRADNEIARLLADGERVDWDARCNATLGAPAAAPATMTAGAIPSKGETLAAMIARVRWTPRLHIGTRAQRAGARTAPEIVAWLCDELLAVPVGASTLAHLTDYLEGECARLDVRPTDSLDPDLEWALRRTAHLVLALPEAHLH